MNESLHTITIGDPKQPAILWLHGFLGSCHEFDGIMPYVQSDFYHICMDLPGHGLTHWSGEYTFERTAQAIVQWLTDQGITQTHLVGYSMGGRLALYLALHFPALFPKVVIESASPGLQTASEQQARLQQDCELADRLMQDFPQFLTKWYDQPLFASLKQHSQFSHTLQQRRQNDPIELARALRGMSTGGQPNLWLQLPQHRHPMLLIVGEHDRKFVALNQAMAALTPAAQLEIIPESGHVVHLEQPIAYVNSMMKFFNQRND